MQKRSFLHSIFIAGFALWLSLFGKASASPICEALFSSADPLEHYLRKNPKTELLNVALKPLMTGAEGLAAKLALIERAQSSIDISYYILRRDDAGYAILNALKGAMSRGVTVRMMVDGMGSYDMTNSHLNALVDFDKTLPASRIQIKIINPIFSVNKTLSKLSALFLKGRWMFSPGDGNNRSHDKILLIDAGSEHSWAILGGRNIGNEYYGLSSEHADVIDYEILVKGGHVIAAKDPLVAVSKYFEILFDHKLNLLLSGWSTDSSEPELSRMGAAVSSVVRNDDIRAQTILMQDPTFWSGGFQSTKAVLVSEVQNLVKTYRESFNRREWTSISSNLNITKSLFEISDLAKKSIEIVSPYPMFAKNDVRRVSDWLLANPTATFSLYTNSYQSTNQMLVTAVFQNLSLPRLQKLQRDPRIGDRLKIYQYQDGSLLHAKAVVIDNSTTLVTTSNFDPRSRIHNSEIGLWSDSELNHGALKKLIASIEARSELIAPDSTRASLAKDAKNQMKLRVLFYLSHLFEIIDLNQLL